MENYGIPIKNLKFVLSISFLENLPLIGPKLIMFPQFLMIINMVNIKKKILKRRERIEGRQRGGKGETRRDTYYM